MLLNFVISLNWLRGKKCFIYFGARTFFFFFFDKLQYINQKETDKAEASSSQTEAKVVGRLLENKQRELKQAKAYFAVAWATEFPLLLIQKKKQEEKDFAKHLMSKTLVEIVHLGLPEQSKMASMLNFKSLSTMIFLQFSPKARYRAHKIASVLARRGEHKGMILVQTLITTPTLSLGMIANVALDWERAASTFILTVPIGGGTHFAVFFSGEGASKWEKT